MLERRNRATLMFAALAIPLAAGAIAGLLDASLAATVPSVRSSFGLFVVSTSLGALAAAIPVLFVIVPAAIALRRPASLFAASVAATVLLPAAFLVARALYKRIPWDAGDLALAAGGAIVLVGLFLLAMRVVRAALGDGIRAERLLARAAVPLLLVASPALVRVIPAAWGELRPAAPFPEPAMDHAGSERRPNLLLISIDTMRSDRFGVTGDPHVRTPYLDRLARGAVQFPVCLAPSPWTLPSLASLLTGVHPGEHRMLQEMTALADSAPSLPGLCREAGWSTGAYVSNPWLATGRLSRGFDAFDVAERLECLAEASPTRLSRALTKAILRTRRLDSGAAISRRGLAWIAARSADEKPWFAWLHYFDPHLPNWPPPPLDRLDGPPAQHVNASITVEEIRAPTFSSEEGRREIARLYDAEVVATDRAIGAVARALDAAALLERSVIVVTADHGEELWEHDGYGHGHSMFEEVVSVPLFIRAGRAPEIDPGIARLVDVAPTAIAALGLPALQAPRGFAGADLLSLDPAPRPGTVDADTAYGEATLYGPEKKFLRTNRWKIIAEIPDSASTSRELTPDALVRIFDLAADPSELHDIASVDSAHTAALRARLADWMHRVGSSRMTTSSSLPDGMDPSVIEQLEALGYTQ